MGAAAAAAAIGGVATLGASALSGGKGSGGGQNGTTSSQPWAPQGVQLQDAYGEANRIYNQNLAAGPYSGNFVAGSNPALNSAIGNASTYANGTGAVLPGQLAGTAGGLMGAANPYVSNAQNLAANGIGGPDAGLYSTLQRLGTGQQTTQGPSGALSSALNQSAVSGAQSLAGFQNGISNVQNQAMSDPTQRTMADAQAYANSPETQAAIQNVNSQIGQTLHEQTVPGLNRQAAMGGSLNSSRAGMAEGMANENAAIAMGNADSQIQNNAFNTGLSTAANQYASGLNTSLNAANSGYNATANNANTNAALQQALGEFNTGTQLNAANSGLNSGLNYALGNANTQLGANSQLGQATGLGIQGAGAANNAALSNFSLGGGAGTLQQGIDQNALANSYDQWQMGNQYDQNMLNNFFGIVGSGNWGGSSSSMQQSTLPPNLAGNALGGAAAGLGLYQKYGSGDSSSNGLGLGAGNSNSIGLFGGQGPIFNPTYGEYNGGQSLYGDYG